MYRRPRKRPYMGWLAALLAVAVVGGLVFGLVKLLGRTPDLDKNAILLPTPDPTGVFAWSDGVLCIRGPQPIIICCDLKGDKPLWTVALPASNMKAARLGDLTTVWGDKQVLLIDEQGVVKWRVPTAGDVVAAAPGAAYYAVVTKEEDQHRLRFYSVKDGTQAGEMIPFPYEIVLGMGFFDDGSKLWVLSADSHGTQPVTKLRTYTPGKTQTQNGEITLNNEIGYSAVLSDNLSYIVGTHTLTAWQHFSNQTDRKLIYGWTMLDSLVDDNGNTGFLLAPSGGSSQISALWYINTSGTQYRIPLPVGCFTAMLSDRGKICVATHNGVWSMALDGSGSRFYSVASSIDSIPAVVPGKAFVIQASHRNLLIPMP